jgi:hypothetical protein
MMARGLSNRVATSGAASSNCRGGLRRWRWGRLVGALLTLQVGGGFLPGVAQNAQDGGSPNQPLAINGAVPPVPSPCRLVVPPDQAVLQPMKILPEQVALKNRLGCLSPSDAVYGPDGCPARLCGKGEGAFQLPPP